MFAAISTSSIVNIGQRNVAATREVLEELRIPIVGEDVGADYGRTMYFILKTDVYAFILRVAENGFGEIHRICW